MRTDNRLRIISDKPFFGPGTAELLEAVRDTGCVRVAAENIGLSYSKARKMIATFKMETGRDAVIAERGGIGGGSASLTDYAHAFLYAYRSWERECREHEEESFARHFEALA